MTTIFSKIIAREVPADIVYEDDIVLAFLDINPVNKGHILVIPKTPTPDMLSTDPETLAHIILVGQKIGQKLMEHLPCDGINLGFNNGAAAGQEVFHTHLHVIPRHVNDDSFSHANHVTYENGEASRLAADLAKHFR